jgi:hypothetical protein
MPQLHKRFHVSSGFTWLLQLLGLTLTNIKTELKAWKPTKNRAINLVIGVSALLIYEFIGRPIYRPYIYSNGINNFHFADILFRKIKRAHNKQPGTHNRTSAKAWLTSCFSTAKRYSKTK